MDTSPSISIGTAFAHCASTGSYWWGIVIVALICVAGWAFIQIKLAKSMDVSTIQKVWATVCLFAIMIAIFMRPCMVATNTSVTMAAAGHWLGY